ncbi:hypothetical protein KO494_06785 [Lacinutrix sp. C3R15]|uniref:hypothetical protein n=1 Tax=Flavobacteriaceae TaxID=49546 RepID=UPI001C086D91|nr:MULTISPECIES: hypothetical protein [Flavobacteriaceae]MBU2939240.1 hypothetical protein [Lacinutrix sp. C3R15]MDO6622555.1 hypothetical protein [Oceanihabitans sp. 1_MG-2023]
MSAVSCKIKHEYFNYRLDKSVYLTLRKVTKQLINLYDIINTSQITLSKPFIKGDVNESFHESKKVTLQNGEHAIVLTYKAPLKLLALSKYQFDLVDVQHEMSKKILSLPALSSAHIRVITENEIQKKIAPIYIYL